MRTKCRRCRHWVMAMICVSLLVPLSIVRGDVPATAYIFPAGGQRGTAVAVRVGGLYLHEKCPWEMQGAGVRLSPQLTRTKTLWFEGPILPLPESQRQEDYPKDMAGQVTIAADAPLGLRSWLAWTSQGVTAPRAFIVGDLPEVVEQEVAGAPLPVRVTLPCTINGRVFPHEDVDLWSFELQAGQSVTCTVLAKKLGSPLEALFEILDPQGRKVAESKSEFNSPIDGMIRFVAPQTGVYQVRIFDAKFGGLQSYVYRLTVSTGPWVDRVYPLGGKRGSKTTFQVAGQGVPAGPVELNLPETSGEAFRTSLKQGNATSNLFTLDVGDAPEYLEAEPNDAYPLPETADKPAEARSGDANSSSKSANSSNAGRTSGSAAGNSSSQAKNSSNEVIRSRHAGSSQAGAGTAVSQGEKPAVVSPPAVELPAVFNGRIDRPGDVDVWWWQGKKGDLVEFDLRASRLGSPLDSVLVLVDLQGKELSRQDDISALITDTRLTYTVPADGVYAIRVEDRLPTRGGPAFAYRLRANVTSGGQPDFQLQLPVETLTVARGGSVPLRVKIERRGGFAGEVQLQLDTLPGEVTATGLTIGPKANEGAISIKAEKTAPVQPVRLRVRGVAKIGDQEVTRVATLAAPLVGDEPVDSLFFITHVPTPYKVLGVFETKYAQRGSLFQKRFSLERGDFEGPLEVSLADKQARHLQGVVGTTIQVPAGATEFDYPIYLPPWMELGRTSRSVVMAVGIIKDADGTEHKVSYTSLFQNEQLIVLVDPGQLTLDLERKSLVAVPGESLPLPIRINRGTGLTGAVKVELMVPEHMQGMGAEAVTIPVGETQGTLWVKFARQGLGPFTAAATVRATLTKGDGTPVVAEGPLELLAPR